MSLSQGEFIAAVNLLSLLSERGPTDYELASELLSLRIGPTHTAHLNPALQLCLSQKLIIEDQERMELSKAGKSILNRSESSSLKLSRELLLLLIKTKYPELISLAFQSPRIRAQNLDIDTKECFDECLLLEFQQDQAASEWWSALAGMGTYKDSSSKATIGKASEQRTIEFEQRRLIDEGFVSSGNLVTWVSKENDFAGFDVLSRNGALLKQFDRNEPLQIEVKTGRIESEESFSFVISSREVTLSRSAERPWALYVWFLSDLPNLDMSRPISLNAEQVFESCPVNSPSSRWEKARLYFDFSRFIDR